MELGVIGLGRMGGNIVRRLHRAGHHCVVYDANPKAVADLAAIGATPATSLADLASKLAQSPRAAWVMLPAGKITEDAIAELGGHFAPGDILIDGGNSNFKDDVRRARELGERGVRYLDVGTSGGVWGLERGYCLMIGGDKPAFEFLDPIFAALAPGLGDIPRTEDRGPGHDPRAELGYLHCGPSGAGHFVKMIHNGIEYGMMQAFAEGFAIMHKKTELQLDLAQVAEVWRVGSVVRSWLLDLTAEALKGDQKLEGVKPWVSDSGEGRWTVAEAIDLDVAAPVITLSLQARLRSRDSESYSDRMLSVMRNAFGGHAMKKD
jgi:6-phosphogluconate dehydrogenase